MTAGRSRESIEALHAEAILWAAAPERTTAPVIAQSFTALADRFPDRPQLRRFLQALAQSISHFDPADPNADGAQDLLNDVLLASAELCVDSALPVPAVQLPESLVQIMQQSGLSEPAARAFVVRLYAEHAAAADGPEPETAVCGRVDSGAVTLETGGRSADADCGLVTLCANDEYGRLQPAPLTPSAGDAFAPGPAGTIWIDPGSRDLLVDAIHKDLLPRLIEQASRPSSADDAGTMDFLLESTTNALSIVGLYACARVLAATRALSGTGTASDALADLASWLIELAERLSSGEQETSTDALARATARLAASCAGLPLPDPGEVCSELERIRVGTDPASVEYTPRTVQPGDLDLRPGADVIPAVLADMLRELPGQAEGLAVAVAALANGDDDALDRARRIAHTLKGDANTVGVRGLANLTHAMEEILVALARPGSVRSPQVLAVLVEAADTAAAMADHLLGRGPAPPGSADVLSRLYATADALERDEPLPQFEVAASSTSPAASESRGDAHAQPVESSPPDLEESIALPRSTLDLLLRLAAESVALGAQLRSALAAAAESRAAIAEELQRASKVAGELDEQVAYRGLAISEKRRNLIAIDPIELDEYNELYVITRRVQESSADARERLRILDESSAHSEALLNRKLRIDDDLQSLIRQSRLVELAQYRARFERAVRQAARMTGKEVHLELRGAETRIDKLILDALIDPLMHLLRNAVDHGIEAPETRTQLGKPQAGRIVLEFRERARILEVRIEDDGAGLDLERIRARGVRLGLIDAGADDPQALTDLLFRAGFSTREHATQVSGRGIGLDVVARRLRSIGGRVDVSHTAGAGTRFDLRVPLSIGSLQVAVVPIAGHCYALATDAIERFEPVLPELLETGASGMKACIDGHWLPAVDIGTLLGVASAARAGQLRVAALIDSGDDRGVVLCERIESLSLVVLESLAEQIPATPGLRGATVLADGRAAPVLDLAECWRHRGHAAPRLDMSRLDETRPARVVVADDSLTIRRALGELLRDAGYEVELARDGLEAMMACDREPPAALLVDLEMPRMNGLELAAHLRKDQRFSSMAIVMITSRTGERHRTLAESAGVDAVLAKPYADAAVLEILGAHLG